MIELTDIQSQTLMMIRAGHGSTGREVQVLMQSKVRLKEAIGSSAL
jgi:hypothetical protein